MPVTIKDVAKAAGVSPSTVTRVIQNKSTISDETKKRVRKAMKELNYHPNLNARSLVSSYTQVIGLVLPDDSDVFYQNPFFPSVLRGIAQVASENHFLLSFLLLIMITSKPDLMRPNISSKKDAVALLSLVVPRSSSLPRTVSQVTSKHFKNTICLLIVTVPSLQTSF